MGFFSSEDKDENDGENEESIFGNFSLFGSDGEEDGEA